MRQDRPVLPHRVTSAQSYSWSPGAHRTAQVSDPVGAEGDEAVPSRPPPLCEVGLYVLLVTCLTRGGGGW